MMRARRSGDVKVDVHTIDRREPNRFDGRDVILKSRMKDQFGQVLIPATGFAEDCLTSVLDLPKLNEVFVMPLTSSNAVLTLWSLSHLKPGFGVFRDDDQDVNRSYALPFLVPSDGLHRGEPFLVDLEASIFLVSEDRREGF